MAKGQMRSNKEAKKPKQKKVAAASPPAFGKGVAASVDASKKKE